MQLVGEPVIIRGQIFSVKGKKVELSATANWLYVGGTAGEPPAVSPLPPVPDFADLQAGATQLVDRGRGLLVDGDQTTGKVDAKNKITVSVSQNHPVYQPDGQEHTTGRLPAGRGCQHHLPWQSSQGA